MAIITAICICCGKKENIEKREGIVGYICAECVEECSDYAEKESKKPEYVNHLAARLESL